MKRHVTGHIAWGDLFSDFYATWSWGFDLYHRKELMVSHEEAKVGFVKKTGQRSISRSRCDIWVLPLFRRELHVSVFKNLGDGFCEPRSYTVERVQSILKFKRVNQIFGYLIFYYSNLCLCVSWGVCVEPCSCMYRSEKTFFSHLCSTARTQVFRQQITLPLSHFTCSCRFYVFLLCFVDAVPYIILQ